MSGKNNYSNFNKTFPITSKEGFITDSIGRVLFSYRDATKINLENYTDEKNKIIERPLNEKLVNFDSIRRNEISCFYDFLSKNAGYYIPSTDNVKNKRLQTINVYKIHLSNGKKTLDVRLFDPFIPEGVDSSGLACLFSIAMHKNEIKSFGTGSNKKIKVYDIKYFKKAEYRRYYYAKLGFVSSENKALTDTGIMVYSVDGQNWMTDAYASSAFNAITGNVWDKYEWDNKVIPNPIEGEPFGANWTGLKNKLQSIIYEANCLPIDNTNKGYRLLDMEIRDYIYQGNLDKVTYEMAFRLPFFMEMKGETPYTKNSKGNFNNPYYTKFDDWFEYANILRINANSGLSKLNEAGQLVYNNNYNDFNIEYYKLMKLVNISDKQKSYFAKYKTPAYVARNYEYENPYKDYNPNAHVPSAESGVTIGFGFDLKSRNTVDEVILYTDWTNLTTNDKQVINLALKKYGSTATECLKNSFWDTHLVSYEIAVKNTPIIAENKDYLEGGLKNIAKKYIKDGIKTNKLYLRIYPLNSESFFQKGNLNQFLNEIEKVVFYSLCWNTSPFKTLNPYRKNEQGKDSIFYQSIAKSIIHAFNTHDVRYLIYATKKSTITHKQKIIEDLLYKNIDTLNYYSRSNE